MGKGGRGKEVVAAEVGDAEPGLGTLKTLCEADKRKVANLIHRVVEAAHREESLRAKLDKERQERRAGQRPEEDFDFG